MKFRPLQDRLLVKRIAPEDRTPGGLFIPDTAKDKPQEGECIAVGKGKLDDHGHLQVPDVQPGDRIMFGKYSGVEIKMDGVEYLILREDDVMGVVEG